MLPRVKKIKIIIIIIIIIIIPGQFLTHRNRGNRAQSSYKGARPVNLMDEESAG